MLFDTHQTKKKKMKAWKEIREYKTRKKNKPEDNMEGTKK